MLILPQQRRTCRDDFPSPVKILQSQRHGIMPEQQNRGPPRGEGPCSASLQAAWPCFIPALAPIRRPSRRSRQTPRCRFRPAPLRPGSCPAGPRKCGPQTARPRTSGSRPPGPSERMHRAARAGARPVARARPANEVEIVQVVGLLAQRHLLPQAQKRLQLRAHGADMVVRDAVIIAVEHARRAALPKRNQAHRPAA